MNNSFLLSAALIVTTFNINAMEHEAPFIGINVVHDKCHIIAEDGAFTYQGTAETKLTMNKNSVLAKCKAEYLLDKDVPIEIDGRVEMIPCRIGIPKTGHFNGIGGFTVSQGGVVSGNCKANRE